MMTAKIRIMPKAGVLDPQGKAVLHSLESLGFGNVEDVRLGKYVEIQMNGLTNAQAREAVDEMCQKLLANSVIESYEFEIS
jgi:phosphoribosylformylglycinamidine synthase PurS subunit